MILLIFAELLRRRDTWRLEEWKKKLPEGWKIKCIDEVLIEKMSGEWDTEAIDGDGIHVLRTTNFTNEGKLNLNDVIRRNVPKEIVNVKKLKYGDIILEKSGGSDNQPVGRVVYFDICSEDEYLCNNFTQILRVNEMFGKYFSGKIDGSFNPLNQISTFIDYRGKSPKKSTEGIPLITAKNIKKGYFRKEPQEFMPPEEYDKWMKKGYPKENDILFVTEGATLGNAAKLPKYDKVAIAQRLINIQCKENIMPDYLFYSLLNDKIQSEIIKSSTGSATIGICSNELGKIDIPLPPPPAKIRQHRRENRIHAPIPEPIKAAD